MAELKIERRLNAPIAKVFAFISRSENLLQWWGPEGMHLPEFQLDFSRTGPWYSVMENAEGGQFRVSGQVTRVDPPNSVSFTWAWHDENGMRGAESHVTLELVSMDENTTGLTLYHRQLENEEVAARHQEGWASSLRKLEALAS